MELNEIRNLAIANQQTIAALNQSVSGIEKRVADLESENNILTAIQITLKGLSILSAGTTFAIAKLFIQ